MLSIILFVIGLFCHSCSHGRTEIFTEGLPAVTDTVSIYTLGQQKGRSILIRDTIDLANCACIIPKGMTLVFKGGYIKNGTLIGNHTRLKSSKACFNHVRILGSWEVPMIKSSLFDDLSYDNALKDVVALADSSINNKIVIGKGSYQVTAYKNGDVCIPVCGNTEIVIDGDIKLTPNDFRNYSIILASGENIKIHGKGSIIGDKHTHTGKTGEWGMGIDVENAHHVFISGLTIKDCWGDCIYIGSESTNVRIEKCRLDHGRRQGISITSADGVSIKNCIITNVGGTAPEYAIDVEPNKGDAVDNILIENVTSNKCKGGFLVYGKAPNAKIGRVIIRKSTIKESAKKPIDLQRCESALVEECVFVECGRKDPIHQEEIINSVIRKNKIQRIGDAQ